MKRIIFRTGLVMLFLAPLLSSGQVNPVLTSKDYDGLHWPEFEKKLEGTFPVRFYYNNDSIPDLLVTLDHDTVNLLPFLIRFFEPYNIYVSQDHYGDIFLIKNYTLLTNLSPSFFHTPDQYIDTGEVQETPGVYGTSTGFLNTYHDFIIENVTIGNKISGFGSTNATVWGYVRSTADSTPVDQANVFIEEIKKLTATNDLGYYRITIPKGKYTLVISSLGSYEKKYKIEVLSDGRLDILLDPRTYSLKEVVINSDRYNNVKGTQMGYEKLTIQSIKEIPVVLGERDLIKVALMLPGVQSVGEGSSGFNVRGSPVDQNMFYINSVPVYNTSHVFGFFSSFNSDAISDFTLFKSNIPIQYGGRLSSIFDITAKQGNQNKFSFRGGLSPIAARLLVEGPFKKQASSYMISARSTYSDWILKMANDPDLKNSRAYFTDAIANFMFRTDDRNRFNLFSYFSHDKTQLTTLTRHRYGNAGVSASWMHIFSNNYSSTVTLVHSTYGIEEKNTEYPLTAYQQSFQLDHTELKTDFTLQPDDNHTVTAGMDAILYQVKKGDFLPLDSESDVIPKQFEPEKGIESALFLADEWKVTPELILNGGLRYSVYTYLGPKTVYTYLPGLPREPVNITDTLYYRRNKIVKAYEGLDIRFGLTYLINDQLSVKVSYNRLHQYLFLLSNTIAVAPTDIWKLCDYHIQPMVGDQYSVGLYSNMLGEYLEISLEGYYKNIQHLIEYKDGVDLTKNQLPEQNILQGNLDSYGVELMIKKPYGNLNGWINYTYSRAIVLVNNTFTGEQINFGKAYPANFDKPHAFNLVANYKISKRFSVSGNIVYSTGRPVTYPTAVYYLNGTAITYYSMRNEYRLPDYFRVDLSFNVEGNLRAKKLIHGSFSFSLYNVTARKNAYSVYFTVKDGLIKAYRMSIFGVPIFSLSYNFKLGNYEN
jgi:hypothetical protein